MSTAIATFPTTYSEWYIKRCKKEGSTPDTKFVKWVNDVEQLVYTMIECNLIDLPDELYVVNFEKGVNSTDMAKFIIDRNYNYIVINASTTSYSEWYIKRCKKEGSVPNTKFVKWINDVEQLVYAEIGCYLVNLPDELYAVNFEKGIDSKNMAKFIINKNNKIFYKEISP